MIYADIGKELENYQGGVFRALFKSEPHVANLKAFYDPLKKFNNQRVTGPNLEKFANIVAEKRGSGTSSSELFKKLAAPFGGHHSLKPLYKANLLKSEFLELLLQYPHEAIAISKILADSVPSKISLACAKEVAIFLQYSKKDGELINPDKLLIALISKYQDHKTLFSEYIAVLSLIKETGYDRNPIDQVFAIKEIVELNNIITRIKNYVPEFQLKEKIDSILALGNFAVFHKLLKTLPVRDSKKVEDLISEVNSTKNAYLPEIINQIEQCDCLMAENVTLVLTLSEDKSIKVYSALCNLNATIKRVKEAQKIEFNEEWAKQIIRTVINNPEHALEVASAVDYLSLTKKMDATRLKSILSKPQFALQLAGAIVKLDEEGQVKPESLAAIDKAGIEAKGMAEFYVELMKVKLSNNLLQLVLESPQYATATGKVLRALIDRDFHHYLPNINYIATHLSDMPALSIAIEELIKANKFALQQTFTTLTECKGDFKQKTWELMSMKNVASSVATKTIVNPARSTASLYGGGANKREIDAKISNNLTEFGQKF